jgi:sulfur-oxidizing protein SoxY
MNTTRRLLLKAAGSAGLIASAVAAGLLKPGWALAEWNSTAFSATTLDDALAAIGASGATTSADVVVKTPDLVENGAAVPVEILTTLPDVESIAILAENNSTPLIGQCRLTDFDGMLTTRIKMDQAAVKVRAIVKAGGKLYTATRDVKLKAGGYGV